jgi:hypothetical protein
MKRFVLGVGAQKAGTSWLRYYLGEQKFSNFGFTKEYHVFDSLHIPHFARFRKRSEEFVRGSLGAEELTKEQRKALYLHNFRVNTGSYFDFFTAKLRMKYVHLTGDITPSYASLPGEVFVSIRREFERRGVTVAPIFLMRDPVYRLQSMVRMKLRDRSIVPTHDQEIALMRQFQGTDEDRLRSNYHETLANLEMAFRRKEIYVQTYEQLFTPATVWQLRYFLKLPLGAAPFQEERNVSRTSNALTQQEYDEFRARYSEVYEGVARMTSLDIGKVWRYKGS